MKPILYRTKSKGKAYAPGAAPKGIFPSPFSFRLFGWSFRETDCVEVAPTFIGPGHSSKWSKMTQSDTLYPFNCCCAKCTPEPHSADRKTLL